MSGYRKLSTLVVVVLLALVLATQAAQGARVPNCDYTCGLTGAEQAKCCVEHGFKGGSCNAVGEMYCT